MGEQNPSLLRCLLPGNAVPEIGEEQSIVVPAIKLLPEDDSKIVTHFEPEEVQKLIQETNREDWQLVVLLAAETGLPLSDVVTMNVESIKFERRCLVVTPRKQMRARNKKTITVPLSDHTLNRSKKLPRQRADSYSQAWPERQVRLTALTSTIS